MQKPPLTTQKSRIAKPLQDLVCFLEGLQDRAPMEELGRLLSDLQLSQSDIDCFAEFGETTYRRNLIKQSQWYELLCICWRSGQRSPIHNHAGSTCGLRIVRGTATETLFETTECGQIKATCSTDYSVGHVCTSQDADVHQVSNLQGSGQDLITLHIYSPPLKTMDTYSLMSNERQLYTPKNETVYCHVGDCI